VALNAVDAGEIVALLAVQRCCHGLVGLAGVLDGSSGRGEGDDDVTRVDLGVRLVLVRAQEEAAGLAMMSRNVHLARSTHLVLFRSCDDKHLVLLVLVVAEQSLAEEAAHVLVGAVLILDTGGADRVQAREGRLVVALVQLNALGAQASELSRGAIRTYCRRATCRSAARWWTSWVLKQGKVLLRYPSGAVSCKEEKRHAKTFSLPKSKPKINSVTFFFLTNRDLDQLPQQNPLWPF